MPSSACTSMQRAEGREDTRCHDPPCPGNRDWRQSCTVTEPHRRGHSERPRAGLSLQTAKETARDSERPREQAVRTGRHRTGGPATHTWLHFLPSGGAHLPPSRWCLGQGPRGWRVHHGAGGKPIRWARPVCHTPQVRTAFAGLWWLVSHFTYWGFQL